MENNIHSCIIGIRLQQPWQQVGTALRMETRSKKISKRAAVFMSRLDAMVFFCAAGIKSFQEEDLDRIISYITYYIYVCMSLYIYAYTLYMYTYHVYTYHVYTYYVDMTSYDYSVRSHSPGFSPVLWAPQVGRYPRCQVTLDHAVVGQKEPPHGKFWKFHM